MLKSNGVWSADGPPPPGSGDVDGGSGVLSCDRPTLAPRADAPLRHAPLLASFAPNVVRDVSVALAGDSVVFTYVSGAGCGRRYEAVAGVADGVLVVTDVGRAADGAGGCLAISYPGGVPVRLAVRAPARGRLAVALRERTESVPAGGGFVERDVLRRTVTVP